MTTSVNKTERFERVTAELLQRVIEMIPRASKDKVAANTACDILTTVINLFDDHANPKPRGYVDVLVHYTEDNA
jgi:hypothetical protein